MLRRPLALAAFADAAVPGLRPVQVQGSPTSAGDRYQVAEVHDSEGREWLVRSSLTTAAGAAIDQSEALSRLLLTRVSYAVPHLQGLARTKEGGTVAIYPQLPGARLSWRQLEARSDEARSVGRAIAELHDMDPRVYDEAGLASYDADSYRSRRLAELDRAASTGHVPTGLLGRWERALEEVTLWKFATVPTHGTLRDGDVLVEDGQVSAIDGWESASISDPAADFAMLYLQAPPDALDTVVEAYAQSRRDRPDTHLERRIKLAAELRRVSDLMAATATDDDQLIDRRAEALRRLDYDTDGDESLMPQPIGRRVRPVAVPDAVDDVEEAAPVDPSDIEVVEVRESNDDDETLEIPVKEPDFENDPTIPIDPSMLPPAPASPVPAAAESDAVPTVLAEGAHPTSTDEDEPVEVADEPLEDDADDGADEDDEDDLRSGTTGLT